MFKKNLPHKEPFNAKKEQFMKDIAILTENEIHSNKLFLCLDEKPQQEYRFSKLEEFLKGTSNLEDISKSITDLIDEVQQLKQQISENVNDLKLQAKNVDH
ncbi:hypothetical protein NQ317_007736 [Molorchus minor]|uniref:Uncharacterized protein n=1 Tax=Molorchus minor TaxID=1323400 RepID=A0ABQ9JUP7_9CUCU|nr:hypothetical protein NQ317_007736 [Molorchus minor]